jgi:hypothetical protein
MDFGREIFDMSYFTATINVFTAFGVNPILQNNDIDFIKKFPFLFNMIKIHN